MTLEFAANEYIRVVNGRTVVTLYVEQPVNADELRAYVRNLKETHYAAEAVEFWVHAVEPKRNGRRGLLLVKMANIFPVDPDDDASPVPPSACSEPDPPQAMAGNVTSGLSASMDGSEQDGSA